MLYGVPHRIPIFGTTANTCAVANARSKRSNFLILDEYATVKVADCEYDLQVPYESDRELDDLIYELLGDIQMAAGDRHCFSESCAQLAGSDRVWS